MTFTLTDSGLPITFTRPGGYCIFVDLNAHPGAQGQQICHDGKLHGFAIGYSGSSRQQFEQICRGWHEEYVRNHGQMSLSE